MILIRADGSSRTGSGHLMRCMTIAQQLAGKENAIFLTRTQESAVFVRERGFTARVLWDFEKERKASIEEKRMEEELPWLEELPYLEAWVKGQRPYCILVDSYQASEEYLAAVSRWVPVIYLDDFGERAYPVSMLVNYNVFADKENYERLYKDRETLCLTGPEYIPIRPAFTKKKYPVRKKAENVLLLTGGGDYYRLVWKFLQEFGKREELQGLHFHLVCGYYSGQEKELSEKADACPNFTLYENVKEIWNLMERCDLAITAGGTTVYELCAMGVPLLGYSFADNQRPVLSYLQDQGIAPDCGDYRVLGDNLFAHMAEVLNSCRNYALRKRISEKEKVLVDGKGAKRIAEAILSCYNKI